MLLNLVLGMTDSSLNDNILNWSMFKAFLDDKIKGDQNDKIKGDQNDKIKGNQNYHSCSGYDRKYCGKMRKSW